MFSTASTIEGEKNFILIPSLPILCNHHVDQGFRYQHQRGLVCRAQWLNATIEKGTKERGKCLLESDGEPV
jgi:hypothetical protein